MADKIEFPDNQPVTLALKYASGREVPGRAGKQVMYTAVTDQGMEGVFFVAPFVAAKITALNVGPGEFFQMTKQKHDGKVVWDVRKFGEQANGTYVIPKAGSVHSPRVSEAGIDKEQQQQQHYIPRKPPVSTKTIREHSQHLAQALHNLRAFAKEKNLTISPDDARSIVISVYIQQMQGVSEPRRAA